MILKQIFENKYLYNLNVMHGLVVLKMTGINGNLKSDRLIILTMDISIKIVLYIWVRIYDLSNVNR